MLKLIAVLLVLAPWTAWGQEARGTLTVAGKASQLSHVYAFWKDQKPFSSDVHLYVFLSDMPLTDEQLPRDDRANAKVAELVRNEKIHAFELHFADVGKTLEAGENGAIYHNGVAPARHGIVGFIVYDLGRLDGDLLEGRVGMDSGSISQAPFRIDATFKVKVPPKPGR